MEVEIDPQRNLVQFPCIKYANRLSNLKKMYSKRKVDHFARRGSYTVT